MDVGAVSEQHLDHLGMLLRHRPHERRLPTRMLIRFHVCAELHERAHRVDTARACGLHERGYSGLAGGVRFGPGLEQCARDGGVPVRRGQGDRRDSEVVGRIDVGARVDQQADRFCIIPVDRPVQSGRPIALGCIHVHVPFEQASNGGPVAPLDRIHQLNLSGGGEVRDQQ